ncbi:phosphodiester glycosidase family protein [Sphingobacterium yanglingense]|uniref:Exopolysaccharide biosynthesis protein n=1 Tax=Sphingobacterium yanglingense TaxID=1437280 RepID=A0A4R6WDV9_9SPHI|nr:phosphodiester glycosidase family protein [Sphingobacterium yanglingense]TDQ75223.1 exopolysaccharide biosynthesis protein [Sphingobacterium yanglingense]
MKSKHTAFFFASFLILTTLCTSVYAQSQDSITFTTTVWKTNTLKRGISWKQANITGLFDSRQEINIIEINLKKHGKALRLAALSHGLEKTSVLAKSHNAIVAINGGFFNMKDGGAVDFIKVDRQIVNTTANHSSRANAYLAFDSKNVLISSDSTQVSSFPNILLSGPFLLKNGQEAILSKNAFNDNRHPRTAIAIKGNNLILFTVDGRNANSQGLSLTELAKIFRWYGCQDAMNLDGGGSTTMYIKGQTEQGVVNYPSDNKQFDHLGERAVANIIYLLN